MTTPPTDLVELGRNVDNCDRHGGSWCSCKVRQFLAALSEWADGALIDPATWTRWDRDDVKLGDEAHVTVANARAAGRYLTKGEIVLLTPRED